MPKFRDPKTGYVTELHPSQTSSIQILREARFVEVVEDDAPAAEKPEADDLTQFPGIGREVQDALRNAGLGSIQQLAEASDEELLAIPGIGDGTLARLRAALDKFQEPQEPEATVETAPESPPDEPQQPEGEGEEDGAPDEPQEPQEPEAATEPTPEPKKAPARRRARK
jgi:hypothetical protein